MRSSLISKTGTLMEWNERAWKDHRVAARRVAHQIRHRQLRHRLRVLEE